ncbi:T9SS type A sorting domain-containing protein [Dyadobacter sp. CY347]|nr:T9SS type A sorting domain-containing protein [Dyadobacter sp. CY347]MCF2488116.1 T9SS type A sorting domain-containing protein [Dyadobacter sp. CY347]
MKKNYTRTHLFSALIALLSVGAIDTAVSQTLPILPSPNHDTNHDALITGSITVNASDQKIAGAIAKLSRVMPGPPQTFVPVSYAISDANGNFVLSGQAGVEYHIDYEFPTAGFTAVAGNPSANFIASAGSNPAPNGGLELTRIANTITNCNMRPSEATDWTGTINVEKAIQLNPDASLNNISVFGSVITSHPVIEITATTASNVRALRIGSDVSLAGPGGYSELLESVKSFAGNPVAQNIVLAGGETLTYYDITSAKSSTQALGSVPIEYTGTGNVTFDSQAFGSKTITTTGGNTSSLEETFAAAGVCLTYTYDIDPLPVTLAHFSVKAEATKERSIANLTWTTTAETNSMQFDIERSSNAKSWTKIGTVEAKGESSTITHYNFSDLLPANGDNFYRLKMIDADQTFAFSGIKNIKVENNLVKIYPNPAISYLQIEPTIVEKISKMEILSQSGRVLQTLSSATQIEGQIDLKRYSPGLYFVRFKFNNGTSTIQKVAIAQ